MRLRRRVRLPRDEDPRPRAAHVFGDFCTGELKAFTNPSTDLRSFGVTVSSLSSFGQDKAGELYALSLGGGVFRIDPAP